MRDLTAIIRDIKMGMPYNSVRVKWHLGEGSLNHLLAKYGLDAVDDARSYKLTVGEDLYLARLREVSPHVRWT